MPKFTVLVPTKAWSHFVVKADNEVDAMMLVADNKGEFDEYSYGEDDTNFNNWEVFDH